MSRSRRFLPVVAFLALLVGRGAAAELEFDFTELGITQTPTLQSCGMGLFTEGGAEFNVRAALGVGVIGSGADDLALDGAESVLVHLVEPTRAVSYEVVHAGNENGTGGNGDARVEAFDPDLNSLGTVAISGLGQVDLGALFGGAAIWSFEIRAVGDALRLGGVTWRPPSDYHPLVKLSGIGDFETASLHLCGVTFIGTNTLRISTLGLGIVGWFQNDHVDGNEVLSIVFDEPARDVRIYSNGVTNQNPNALFGEGRLSVFDEDHASLGLANISSSTPIDVSALYAAEFISEVQLTALEDGRRISGVQVPEPAAAAGAAAALVGLASLARRRASVATRAAPCGR